jgi:hypothetical protein
MCAWRPRAEPYGMVLQNLLNQLTLRRDRAPSQPDTMPLKLNLTATLYAGLHADSDHSG